MDGWMDGQMDGWMDGWMDLEERQNDKQMDSLLLFWSSVFFPYFQALSDSPPVDVVVNSAGITHTASLLETSREVFQVTHNYSNLI